MAAVSHHRITINHRERSYDIAYFVREGTRGTLLYLHGLGCTKEDFLGTFLVVFGILCA